MDSIYSQDSSIYEKQYKLKITVMGSEKSGKSAFVKRFVKKNFIENSEPTMSGTQLLNSYLKQIIQNSHIGIFAIDLTKNPHDQNIEQYIDFFNQNCDKIEQKILIGMKTDENIDLNLQKETIQYVQNIQNKYQIPFVKCSSLKDLHIKQSIMLAIKNYINKWLQNNKIEQQKQQKNNNQTCFKSNLSDVTEISLEESPNIKQNLQEKVQKENIQLKLNKCDQNEQQSNQLENEIDEYQNRQKYSKILSELKNQTEKQRNNRIEQIKNNNNNNINTKQSEISEQYDYENLSENSTEYNFNFQSFTKNQEQDSVINQNYSYYKNYQNQNHPLLQQMKNQENSKNKKQKEISQQNPSIINKKKKWYACFCSSAQVV
ncbi:P-loop containing nucleoside triphosphate hydrolase [Pseudocohnilembus persalinus]|uniref:p-loop containing nucleoside triphosphate hydrolase n=1 Tax=Pseudocohnilembus persalinus TaxID=266149 RepID=A0A0V0R9J3_PSEPJ|nr:P-loop containing nucleoside triphosphate hydrolase [Pseudocohnilembus persalinus]|eukprot:KRX11122.1 P-loop containing nucleoside triphosphate hydrolase [Pseudocohnilembus persalinus]